MTWTLVSLFDIYQGTPEILLLPLRRTGRPLDGARV